MTDKVELQRRLKEASCSVLLMGDLHLRDHPPRNCTPSYLEDILEILDFTAKLEHGLDLSAVVWAGDIFDHKQPSKTSHRLMLKTIEAVKKYRNLLIVTGNHDIVNDRLESVREQQPLGVLFESGAEELTGWHQELPIFGVPWQQDWLEEGTAARALGGWRAGSPSSLAKNATPARSLVVTHAPIYPPVEAQSIKFELVPCHELAEAMGGEGSLYYGHIHDDHGIYNVGGVDFANVGAISRGSLTEHNKERNIKAALWTPEHGFLEIDLPHKPAEEVFRIEEAQALKDDKISLEGFLEDVGSTRLDISSTSSVVSYIQQLDDEKVSKPVKAVSIKLLEAQDA